MKPQAVSAEIQVRHCHGLAEFEACLELQQRVWGGDAIDVVPLPLFVVAEETGGQVLGAFAGRTMVGFTLAVVGVRQGKAYLHSHMTAVQEGFRDRGIGRQLKLFQRQDALSRGIELVEWTFDPRELKNAYFNLMRLGAIARRYLSNCYGITSSPLHAGLPTDRLMAEWWLASPRVEQILAGGKADTSEGEKFRIHVPARPDASKEEALRVQAAIRRQFEDYFGRGYTATGLELDSGGGDYLLEQWPL